MSLWSMNDGSALSHNITTNGSTTVTSAGTSFITDGIQSGDVIVTEAGEVLRVKSVDSSNSLTLTAAASGSEANKTAQALRKPPMNGSDAAPDTTVFGVSVAEQIAGSDNISAIAQALTTLGTRTYEGGSTYNGSAPTVTIGPATRHIVPTSDVDLTDDTVGTITITGHGMATGTALVYTSGGNNMEQANTDIADGTTVFAIRYTADKIKLASSLANANAGTALNLDDAGNDSQQFQGVLATATATISGGSVTGFTITNVGSNYQSVPDVTIAAPVGSGNLDLTDAAVLIKADDEIVVPANFYAAITTGVAVTYTEGGSGAQTDLTTGTVYYLIKSGTANKISLATSYENAINGTKIDLTDEASGGTAHTLVGATATATASRGAGGFGANSETGFHVGWVKRTVGTGGRAGRVQYETLVAASSISGDFEDIAFVEDA